MAFSGWPLVFANRHYNRLSHVPRAGHLMAQRVFPHVSLQQRGSPERSSHVVGQHQSISVHERCEAIECDDRYLRLSVTCELQLQLMAVGGYVGYVRR